MEYDKENNMVPALKIGSGSGSGLNTSSRNQIFAQNMVIRRNDLGYTQQKITDLTGIGLKTIQNYEAGSWPKGDYAIALAEVLECSLDWLLMNSGPKPGPPGRKKQTDKPEPLYNKVEIFDRHVAAPGAEYNTGMDDFGKAVSGLKEIFDSGDPVLIPAIRVNIHAFQISVRRETDIQEQKKEINNLKKRMESLEKRINESDRRKQDRRLHEIEPPGVVERRSETDRRKNAAGE